jgi:hypothetical protein
MVFSLRSLLAVLTVALASGCAGTNFKRSDAQSVVLGHTTVAEVTRIMGTPRQTGEILANGQKLRLMTYAYAAAGGEPQEQGVTPARGMTYSTFNEVVVAQTFISSFKQDATDFDDAKVASIVKGKTTRTEVLALLGPPHGEAVYPVIKEKTHKAVMYNYTHVKMVLLNPKIHSKSLVVAFGPSDVVEEVIYASNGQR